MTIPSLYLPATTIKPTHITLPGSKSISNRILLLAALSDNQTEIHSLLNSDDTARMLEALKTLGVNIQSTAEKLLIHGCHGQFPNHKADLFLGNAGTAFRPLVAVLSVLGGHYRLHGVARMHERPIGDLVDALRQIGAHIDYEQQAGFPPLLIHPRVNQDQHTISVKGNVSSQFLTALLMALPLTQQEHVIEVTDTLISKPYIEITLKLMAQFGIQILHENFSRFFVPACTSYHSSGSIHVEGDASSASYFLAAGLITGIPVRVYGIDQHSIQGDVAFARELEKIGANITWGKHFIEVSRPASQPILSFDLDANHIPDAAMTLVMIALATKQRCRLRNIGSWRVKETDRLYAMATELRKLGVTVTETADSLSIEAPEKLNTDVHIHTYDDHRMAMCFSLVSLLNTAVYIDDPQCVNKTFPDYFQVFASLSNNPEATFATTEL
ncbi:3-phosphoshikimate 1-carboxyvinyltransferase [Neisseriaceae bacterium ESL0693]|nr:3-phosphoshikimate 1-carboxyvinyltransferase [Neisseriaceae bacterium ESL0693]